MNFLYDLYIRIAEEECGRKFWTVRHIGTFRSEEDAIAAKNKVTGKTGPSAYADCETRIQKADLIGAPDTDSVYRFFGYSTDSSPNLGSIQSPYYADKPTAIEEFIKTKKQMPRLKWLFEMKRIGECARFL